MQRRWPSTNHNPTAGSSVAGEAWAGLLLCLLCLLVVFEELAAATRRTTGMFTIYQNTSSPMGTHVRRRNGGSRTHAAAAHWAVHLTLLECACPSLPKGHAVVPQATVCMRTCHLPTCRWQLNHQAVVRQGHSPRVRCQPRRRRPLAAEKVSSRQAGMSVFDFCGPCKS